MAKVKTSGKIDGRSAVDLKSSFVSLVFLSYLLIGPYNFFKNTFWCQTLFSFIFGGERELLDSGLERES
jgi:hypothetical protein